jgi:chemotaxis protein CheX
MTIDKLNPKASCPVPENLLMLPKDRICLPFIESTKFVFATMLGCDVLLGDGESDHASRAPHDVHGRIDFSGTTNGCVVLSFDQQVVFEAANVMLGELPTKIDSDVLDLVGELANLIGGNGKERLADKAMKLGLPQVDDELTKLLDKESRPAGYFPFSTAWGQFSVEVFVRG